MMNRSAAEDLLSGQRLITFMGYVLGAVGLSGIVKLLIVPHSTGNALIVLGVCGVSLYFSWTVITEERRLKRMLAARDQTSNKDGAE